MSAAPSVDELLSQGRAEIIARRDKLMVRPGDVSLAFLHACVAMADAAIRYAAERFRETFYSGARGERLTELVRDRTLLERELATPAQAQLTITRAAAGPAGTIDEGTVVSTAPDSAGRTITFQTDAAVIWAEDETGAKVVGATCTVTGREGNVAAGTLTIFPSPPSFDPGGFAVTNADPAAGGNAEQSDPELLERVRNFYRTVGKGTRAAVAHGAKEVSGVRLATVDVSPHGIVQVAVADADGGSTLQMQDAVDAELDNWACAGDLIAVTSSDPLLVNVHVQLVVVPGFAVGAMADEFADAIRARTRALGVGETLHLHSLIGAIIAIEPSVLAGNFVTPTSDVTPSPGQVIRPGTIIVEAA